MLKHHLIAYGLFALALMGLLHVPTAGQAGAQNHARARAKQHFENGKILYADENYEGAAAEFQASVDAYPSKSGFFNLANCYKALHRYTPALEAIEQLRGRFAEDLKSDPDFQERVEKTERSILERAGRLIVTTTPLRARISVDGEPVGTTPFKKAFFLGPGEHTVRAELPGFVTEEKRISVLAKSDSRVGFQLEQEQARLIVTVSVKNAEVRLDGALVGRSPLKDTLVVEPGRHTVDVTLEGYFADHREFELAAGEQVLLDVTLVSEKRLQGEAPTVSSPMLKTMAWGLGSTVVFGGTSAVLFYFRGQAIDDFRREDDAYSNADDEDAFQHDKARDRAASRAQLFHGFAIAAAVTAGLCAVGTLTTMIIAASKDKKKAKSKAEIQAGLFSLGVKF